MSDSTHYSKYYYKVKSFLSNEIIGILMSNGVKQYKHFTPFLSSNNNYNNGKKYSWRL